MIAKAAIVFVGVIVAAVFLNLYFAACVFVTIFLLGLDNPLLENIQYWACFAAGAATSFSLMRRIWPKPAPAKVVARDEER